MFAPPAVLTLPVPENLPDGHPPVSELKLSEPGVMPMMTPLDSRMEVAAMLAMVYRHVTLIPADSQVPTVTELM